MARLKSSAYSKANRYNGRTYCRMHVPQDGPRESRVRQKKIAYDHYLVSYSSEAASFQLLLRDLVASHRFTGPTYISTPKESECPHVYTVVCGLSDPGAKLKRVVISPPYFNEKLNVGCHDRLHVRLNLQGRDLFVVRSSPSQEGSAVTLLL